MFVESAPRTMVPLPVGLRRLQDGDVQQLIGWRVVLQQDGTLVGTVKKARAGNTYNSRCQHDCECCAYCPKGGAVCSGKDYLKGTGLDDIPEAAKTTAASADRVGCSVSSTACTFAALDDLPHVSGNH